MSSKEHDACIMIYRCVKSPQVLKTGFPSQKDKILHSELAEFGENQGIKCEWLHFLRPHSSLEKGQDVILLTVEVLQCGEWC